MDADKETVVYIFRRVEARKKGRFLINDRVTYLKYIFIKFFFY